MLHILFFMTNKDYFSHGTWVMIAYSWQITKTLNYHDVTSVNIFYKFNLNYLSIYLQ